MRRHSHRHYARLLLLSSLLVGATAHAQTKNAEIPSPSLLKQEAADKAAAEVLFQKGKALYSQGKAQEAYEAYKKAWSLRKTYEVAGNLGNVALELGKAREAAEYLAYSRALFPARGNPGKLARLEASLEEARSQVATVRVEVRRSGKASGQGSSDTAEVIGDGQLVGRAPLGQELFLDPGHYTIKATLPGYADGERVIHAVKGSVETVVLTLEANKVPDGRIPRGRSVARAQRAAPKDAATTAPEWREPVLVAGLGVAALGLGLGIGSWVHSGARLADRDATWIKLFDAGGDSTCHSGGGANGALCTEFLAADADARAFRTLSIASFVAGGAGAVTGLALLILRERASPSRPQGQSAMSFSFELAPGASAAWVRGSF